MLNSKTIIPFFFIVKVSLLNNQFKENRSIFKLFWKYSTHVFVTARFANIFSWLRT